MDKNNSNNKKTLNNTLINIINFIGLIIILSGVIATIYIWTKSRNYIVIAALVLSILGAALNIYLLSKEKN
ncbi:hypothetical protein [Inconstantimicrobium porci]|uniref:hypothetical protein n=1 Tax=Inconstantimicrobium porci TaxID=2652291 RepID=UPI00240A5402|nr:hypothetical protein [Inconstantimicrobium porci]MDD6769591.1 hypothetical protein [Inconstantimicrobium porci]